MSQKLTRLRLEFSLTNVVRIYDACKNVSVINLYAAGG